MVGIEPTPKKDTSLSRTRLPIPPHKLGVYWALTIYGVYFIKLTTFIKKYDYYCSVTPTKVSIDFYFVY